MDSSKVGFIASSARVEVSGSLSRRLMEGESELDRGGGDEEAFGALLCAADRLA